MKPVEIDLPKEIKRLELSVKNLVTSRLLGNYKSVFKGKGLEFESYREYSQEDDSGLIDWKASARVGKILVKEFKEERNLNVMFILDTSSRMLFGSTEKLKSQYSTELVASLSYVILNANDNISLIALNKKSRKVIPLANGKKQFYKVISTLLDNSIYGDSFDLEEALKMAMYSAKRGTLIVIVSDFIDPKGRWRNLLKIASKKYDIIGIMVRDPRDRELPPGYLIRIEDPETGRTVLVDTSSIKDKFSTYSREEEAMIKKEFIDSNADFLSLSTSEDFIKPIISFFKRRERRWR